MSRAGGSALGVAFNPFPIYYVSAFVREACSPAIALLTRAGGRAGGLADDSPLSPSASPRRAAFSKGWLGRELNLKPGFPRRSPATSKLLSFN